MRRAIATYFLPLLFVWYIGGVSIFPHTHIVGGTTIVHSHPNPGAEHPDEGNFLTIQILADFQSVGAGECIHLPQVYEILLNDRAVSGDIPLPACIFNRYFSLRAPPAA